MQFVLSRKQAPKSGGDPPNDPNAPTQAATASLYGPPARSTSLSTIPHINSPSLTVQSGSNGSKSAASSAASAATAAQESLASAAEGAASQHIEAQGMPMHVSAADQRHIHEENQQLLQSMSPAEVCNHHAITMQSSCIHYVIVAAHAIITHLSLAITQTCESYKPAFSSKNLPFS